MRAGSYWVPLAVCLLCAPALAIGQPKGKSESRAESTAGSAAGGKGRAPAAGGRGKAGAEHGKAGEEHGMAGAEHGKAGEKGLGAEHGKAGEEHGKAGEEHGKAGAEHGKAGAEHGKAGARGIAMPDGEAKADKPPRVLRRGYERSAKAVLDLDEGSRAARREDARKRVWGHLKRHLPEGSKPEAIEPPVRQELRHHARRLARLERIRSLAEKKGNERLIERIDWLIERETYRHDRRMAQLLEVPEPTVAPPEEPPAAESDDTVGEESAEGTAEASEADAEKEGAGQ